MKHSTFLSVFFICSFQLAHTMEFAQARLDALLQQGEEEMCKQAEKLNKELIRTTELIERRATRERILQNPAKKKFLDENPHYYPAVLNNTTDDMQRALQAGADPNAKDDIGRPVLTIATDENDMEAFNLLLQQPRIDINAQDQSNHTALYLAILSCHNKMAKTLLARGAAIARDVQERGEWACMLGCRCIKNDEDEEILTIILTQAPFLIHATDTSGLSAYLWAVSCGNNWVARRLRELGADITLRDNKGMSATDHARDYNTRAPYFL